MNGLVGFSINMKNTVIRSKREIPVSVSKLLIIFSNKARYRVKDLRMRKLHYSKKKNKECFFDNE